MGFDYYVKPFFLFVEHTKVANDLSQGQPKCQV